ncbi:MAG: hypothetical protein JJLCMIEE_00841 [Acidimicrobiales bacterium]|nr:hypothetical protein [Acidimicrobiales bacterium]
MSRIHGDTVVLGYHRVASPPDDPYMLSVHPDRFAEHLDVIGAGAQVVPLPELRRAVRSSSKRPLVALTFDDGYRDNLTTALPLLDSAGVPATLFVTSRVIEGGPPFWWDRLTGLLGDSGDPDDPRRREVLRVEIGGRQLMLDARTDDDRRRALQVLSRRLQRRAPVEIDGVLAQIEKQLDCDSAALEAGLLDEAGVARLASSALMTIGSHTHNHPWLAVLDYEEQFGEINRSCRLLEEVTGDRVDLVAYPFGGHGSFGPDTERACRRAGIEFAFTTVPGSFSWLTPRLRVPRRVVRDWPGEEFEQHLAAWSRGHEVG